MTNRKSHIRPFDWCQYQRLWMALNGRHALYGRKDASFGAHHKSLNEDRPIPLAAKCRPMNLLSGDVMLIRIFRFWRGGVKQQWGCRQRQPSAFSLAVSSETLEISQHYYIATRSPSSAFQWSQNAWHCFEWPWWLFRVKFCFRAGLSGARLCDFRLRKN